MMNETVAIDETYTTDERPVVLIIEDDGDVAELYCEYLSDSYEVPVANTGPEAVALLSDSVDVVILDRNLGNWTGKVILGVIQDKRLDCPVLMVTGEEPELEIANYPIEDYLTKPVKMDTLEAKVEEMFLRKTCPRTEQELLSLLSRQQVLEEALSSYELKESIEYEQLLKRIELAESELEAHPTEMAKTKFQPSKCSSCELRWDVNIGDTVGFRPLGSYVWKCNQCGSVESIRNPEKRRVARR